MPATFTTLGIKDGTGASKTIKAIDWSGIGDGPFSFVTVLVDEAGAKQLIQVEDDAHASGDAGIMGLAVRKDAPAALAGTDGDYAPLEVDAAGKVYIATDGDLIDVTLSLDTSAYADGDVMADTQSVTSAVRSNGGRAVLQSVQVLDEDDVGQTFDIIFLSANNSLGTENSAPNISDANARDILGRVRVSDTDYIDLGGCKIATKTGIGLVLEAAAGSTTLYVGTIIRGAGTYTASGVRLKLGLLWD